MSPFLQAAFALAASGAISFGLYRLPKPTTLDVSRGAKGRRFGATTGSFIALATLTRAFSSWDNIELWIAVPLLTGIGWLLAFLLGWVLTTKAGEDTSSRLTSDKQPTPTASINPTDAHWAQAAAELDSANRRPGLWARSFSEARGNEAEARANYLRHRALEFSGASSVSTLAVDASNDRQQNRSEASSDSGDQELQAAVELVAKYGETAVRNLKHAHRTVGDVIPASRLANHIIAQYEGRKSD